MHRTAAKRRQRPEQGQTAGLVRIAQRRAGGRKLGGGKGESVGVGVRGRQRNRERQIITCQDQFDKGAGGLVQLRVAGQTVLFNRHGRGKAKVKGKVLNTPVGDMRQSKALRAACNVKGAWQDGARNVCKKPGHRVRRRRPYGAQMRRLGRPGQDINNVGGQGHVSPFLWCQCLMRIIASPARSDGG